VVNGVAALSQSDRLNQLLSTSSIPNNQIYSERTESFFNELAAKKCNKSDESFLKYMFKQAHVSFFKKYSAYAHFTEIFDTGKYDCLTATSFLSLALDKFDFEYEIIETNYHIFLMVDSNNGKVLLETTDLANGFVSDPHQINERIKAYHQNILLTDASQGKSYYEYDFNMYRTIEPTQLVGLLYFNQSIVAFNNNQIKESVSFLRMAIHTTYSSRITEFAKLLMDKIVNSDLSDNDQKELIKILVPLTRGYTNPIAAAR
jgi:hypothetical protein